MDGSLEFKTLGAARKPWTSRSGAPTRRLTVRGFFYAVARRRTATRTGRERQNQTHSIRRDAVAAAQVQESWNHTYISPNNHASSSAATLPVTMKTAQRNLGVSEEVASFVLPLGATINMDGTGLYQAVAAVFIAQTLGISLDLSAQLTIVFLALLASIGTAAVPSAGVGMLVVILETGGVPAAGIALILGVDRILDMARTAANVTGDVTVSAIVAASEGQLTPVGGAAVHEG